MLYYLPTKIAPPPCAQRLRAVYSHRQYLNAKIQSFSNYSKILVKKTAKSNKVTNNKITFHILLSAHRNRPFCVPNGRRGILDPQDNMNAHRANIFGLDFDQTESLWNMGYKNGGNLRL